jgi:hypothetical protein
MSNPPNVGTPLRPPHIDSNPEDPGDINRRELIEPIPEKQLPNPALDPTEGGDTDEATGGQRRPI